MKPTDLISPSTTKIKDLLSTALSKKTVWIDLAFINKQASHAYYCETPTENCEYQFSIWLPSDILDLTVQELLSLMALGVVVITDKLRVSSTLDTFLDYLKSTMSNE